MKINSITSNTLNLRGPAMLNERNREKECVKERDNLRQNNYDNINTSIKSNPDARVSFKGGHFIHSAANFASDNPLVAEALFAILITCILRPISIMATANSESDKEKCSYQAAKSISSGVVGLATTVIVGSNIASATKSLASKKENNPFEIPKDVKEKADKIISEGVNELKNIADKLRKNSLDNELITQIEKITKNNDINLAELKKLGKDSIENIKDKIKKISSNSYKIVVSAINERKSINNYKRTAKNVADKLFQPIFMPIRATITIAAIPSLLKFLGLKKPDNKQQCEHNNFCSNFNNDVFFNSKDKMIFDDFLQDDNKIQRVA